MSGEKTRGPKKIANGIVALSSAAVLSVYAAGYARTRSAAERLEHQTSERLPHAYIPAPSSASVSLPLPDEVKRAELKNDDARRDDAIKPVKGLSSAPPELTATLLNAETPQVVAPSVEAPVAAPVSMPKAVDPPVAAPVEIAATAPSTPPNAVPPAPANNAAAVKWNDGRYLGWGTSRHGDIQAAVVIEGGRIASATIADCRTRYSCSVIDKLPPEVAQRQSPEVDYVSGATQSTNAFYYAVVEALAQARVR